MHKMRVVAAVGARSLPRGALMRYRAASTSARRAPEEEYLQEAAYPPVLPEEQLTQLVKDKLAWHEKVARLPTYEQKICELNMPKGYGYYCVLLDDRDFKLGGLPFLKFITRTDVEEGLPQGYYKEVAASSRVAAERLAPLVEDLVRLHFASPANRPEDAEAERDTKTDFLKDLHRLLATTLPAARHAKAVAGPRIKAFWLAGGVHHEGADRKHWEHLKPEEREKKHWVENLWRDREDPHMGDHPVDSISHPLLSLRERAPLPPVLARPHTPTDPRAVLAHPFPSPPTPERLSPESYDYESDFRTAALLPGYWPGESHRHQRLHYHAPHYRAHTSRYGASHAAPHKHITVGAEPEETEAPAQKPAVEETAVQQAQAADVEAHQTQAADASAVTSSPEEGGEVAAVREGPVQHRPSDPLHHQLLVSAHTQALAQAGVAGFGPVTELTYPIVHHNLVSDGHTFVLSLHQCNTIALHSGNTSDLNPHRNKIWVSPEMKLWDDIDSETGEVVGLNKDLLAQLAAIYQKETVKVKDETPFLGSSYKYLWSHPASERYRGWFHEKIHTLTSGRLWFRKRPELTAWERIYKLDFNSMPEENDGKKFYDAGYFQMFPWNRTMKHNTSKLIRKDDRPLGKYDPVKRVPLIDSEKLFDKYAREYRNWRLF